MDAASGTDGVDAAAVRDDPDTAAVRDDPDAASGGASRFRPVDQTPAEARRAERGLTPDERGEVQNALEWEGVYAGAIDADFGAGTRAAMRAWQRANDYPVTGVMTEAQRAELIGRYRAVLAELGMELVRDVPAGVEIALPMAVLELEAHDPPFARYAATDGGPAQALLISRTGDGDTLRGLYEVMQTLSIVPPEGPRERRERSFTLEGRDDEIASTTYAELVGGEIKGYTLVWPAGDERRRGRVLDEMRASFTRLDGVLPTPSVPTATSGADILAGLEVRRPDRVRSGFFVDARGTILSSADLGTGCRRLELGGGTPLEPVAADAAAGLILLRPAEPLAPIDHARFSAASPPADAEVAAAGFAYGGRLPGPTLRYGAMATGGGLEGGAGVRRLTLAMSDSAAGGPVFDAGGGVWGMLLAPAEPDARLPEGVSFAAGPEAIAAFLTEHGVAASTGAAAGEIAPEDLARRAADVTVSVTCWN